VAQPSDAARRLASLAMSAARWEWVFDDRDKGLLTSDLAGLIYQLAPLARVSEDRGPSAARGGHRRPQPRATPLDVAKRFPTTALILHVNKRPQLSQIPGTRVFAGVPVNRKVNSVDLRFPLADKHRSAGIDVCRGWV